MGARIPADDLARADQVIRTYRLCSPADPVGQFTYPRTVEGRRELADFLYDVADRHAARAAMDAPRKHRVLWEPPNG